jgi:thymidylate synthase
MHLKTRNVNTAFRELVSMFSSNHNREGTVRAHFEDQYIECSVVKEQSRNGPVLRIAEPVTITYSHPKERVLFNAARDANPFALLYEALWMLAGRDDVAPLAYYTKRFADYSDDGKTLNGAYGYRWRHGRTPGRVVETYGDERDGGGITGPGIQTNRVVQRVDVDQLDLLVAHLRADPTSRRAVLQMWNVEDDLLKIGQPSYMDKGLEILRPGHKDVCCNLSVMFSIRKEFVTLPDYHDKTDGYKLPYLDMTVVNRSNDLVWGTCAADFMCFSVLQEYVAARLGVEVGLYHHVTNNLHVYTESNSGFKPDEWLGDSYDSYTYPSEKFPIVKDPAVFERELPLFVSTFSGDDPNRLTRAYYEEPFLEHTAFPMMTAFGHYKRKDMELAMRAAEQIAADDWRIAATGWFQRRIERRAKK